MQNLCVSPRWHSRPPLTVILYILQIAHTCPRLFSPSRPYLSPSGKCLRPPIIFSKTPLQTSTCRAIFNLPECTLTRPAARTGLFQAGGAFATVPFDFDARG